MSVKNFLDIQSRMIGLGKDVREMKSEMVKVRAAIDELKEDISRVEVDKVAEVLRFIERKAKRQTEQFDIQVTKICVFTEVTARRPDLAMTIVHAMNQPSDWWAENSELTLNEWEELLDDMPSGFNNARRDGSVSDEHSVYLDH